MTHTAADDLDVYDHIAELTRPHTSAQPYEIRRGTTTYQLVHRVRVPSLLHQLEHATPSGQGDDRTSSGYESRPAAALEAMNVLQTIDTGTSVWLRRLRPGTRTWGDTDQLLAALAGTVRGLDPGCGRRNPIRDEGREIVCCDWHRVAADVRRWWTAARVAAGWDTAAWRPDNTCPMCGVRGGLRVKEADKVAMCVECHETWSPGSIGLLAEHIRGENAVERRSAADLVVCWCPWPQPVFERWPALCPSCGSRFCHRAAAGAKVAS